ncbi:MAG: hypothetical protein ABI811_01195 [Acidobacteriota bacterium]
MSPGRFAMTGNGSGNPGSAGPKRVSPAKPNVKPGLKFGAPRGRMSPLPMEWMDPMSWRLPSGKALAEFALQSGFLAPLLMGSPMGGSLMIRHRKPVGKLVVAGNGPADEAARSDSPGNPPAGVPVSAGSFRDASPRSFQENGAVDKFRESRYGSAQ